MGGSGGLGPALAHGLDGKPHVVVHIERSRLVVCIELVVAARKLYGVVPANADGELAPLVVGVNGQERVVQVEQRQPGAICLGISH